MQLLTITGIKSDWGCMLSWKAGVAAGSPTSMPATVVRLDKLKRHVQLCEVVQVVQ